MQGVETVPREVFHALFEPKVTFASDKDLVIVRVRALGLKDGREAEALVEMIDYFDDETGFTAMERGTGWSAAIVAQMMARDDFEVAAVNDLADAASLAYLLKYDTVHGRYPGTVEAQGEDLVVDGKTIPVTNKPIRLQSCNLFRVEDGKITERHLYFDQLGFMTQLGLAPQG